MPLRISDELREKLRLVRESQLRRLREGLGEHDYYCQELMSVNGVHVCGSIGFDIYLTFDGRILASKDSGDPKRDHPPRETSNIAWIALGLSTLSLWANLPEVLEFLPVRPTDVAPCSLCGGVRFQDYPDGSKQACRLCHGLGWGEPTFRDY